MVTQFIEVTIVSDSSDAIAKPRKGSIAVDQVASLVDIDGQGPADRARTKVTLREAEDYINTDDEAGGVVRASRTLYVQEAYELVRAMVVPAGDDKST